MAKEITGIFSGDDQKRDETNPNTPEQQKIVDMVDADLNVFKSGRNAIEEIWREEDRFYEGGRKQWEGLRSEETMKVRPNSTDNIAFSQIESIVSALTGWTPEGQYEAVEPSDEQKAQELQKYMPFEMRKIKFKAKHVKAVRRFVNHGLLLYKVVHDPTKTGGRGANRYIGQNDIIPLDYGSFFPDPRIGDLLYLQDSKGLILRFPKDIEYFPERWPGQGKKVQPSEIQDELFEHSDDYQAEKSQRAELIEYWYKGKPKIMTEQDKETFRELAAEKLAEGKDPTEALAKAEGKATGIHCIYVANGVFLEHKSYVYDHGQYPVVVRCLFPVEGSIWPKGYMRDLISPQTMLNKFSELAVEQTAKMGNGAIIYEEGAIAASKIPLWKRIRSTVGAMLPVLRMDAVKEIEGKGPPPMIMNFIQHWLMVLQKIPRRFDSINGGANFAGESGRHAEALQSAAQGNLSTATELIEDGLAEVHEQYIELMAQFYTTERIGRVLGKPVSISRKSLLSQSPTTFQDDELGEVEAIEEYVPEFDISVRIGVEKPTDREYWVQTAFTLLKTIDPVTQQPMIDAEAVRYTVENGRMEPFEVIEERMKREQQLMMQMQQLQQQLQQSQQENAQLNEEVRTLANAVNVLQGQQSEIEQRRQRFQDEIQQRKTDIEAAKVLAGMAR